MDNGKVEDYGSQSFISSSIHKFQDSSEYHPWPGRLYAALWASTDQEALKTLTEGPALFSLLCVSPGGRWGFPDRSSQWTNRPNIGWP